MSHSPRSEGTDDSGQLQLPLLALAIGYNLGHHNGTFSSGLGSIGGTRIADWLDLAAPIVVLVPAVWVLVRAAATRRTWLLFALGVYAYIEGHGIHLSANSISNVVDPAADPDGVIHLWDEVVGHYLWYAGVAFVFAAVVRAIANRPLRLGFLGTVGEFAVGLTWGTNALEGGTAVASLVVAMLAIVHGIRHPAGLGRSLAGAGAVAVVVLSTWAAIHGGSPQPSSL